MQWHNKRVSAERCIFHSNRSACTDRGGERPRPPSWNRGWSGRDSNSTGKGQCSAVHKEKQENNTEKATKESSGIRYSSLAPFISATEEQKKQPLHPKGSLSIPDSSQEAFYIPGSLTSVRVGFSFDCLRTTRSSRGRNASDAAAATRPCQQDPGLLPRNTCLHTGMLCSLPPGPAPGNGSHRRCASPSHAAGAGKRRRGGSCCCCCCSADFSAPTGDFELTSGGCRVRQLEQQAGCAQLPQEVPDLLPRPC